MLRHTTEQLAWCERSLCLYNHPAFSLYTLHFTGGGGCPSLDPVPCSDIFLVDDTLHVRLSIHEEKLVFGSQCNGGLLLAFSWHFVSCGLVVLDARELLMCESVHVFSTSFFLTYWSSFFSFCHNFDCYPLLLTFSVC